MKASFFYGKKIKMKQVRISKGRLAVQWAGILFSPVPLLLIFWGTERFFPFAWHLAIACVASISTFSCAVTLFRWPGRERFLV